MWLTSLFKGIFGSLLKRLEGVLVDHLLKDWNQTILQVHSLLRNRVIGHGTAVQASTQSVQR
jgi:ATP-dependent Clp protease ATP-binding subunit ClpA